MQSMQDIQNEPIHNKYPWSNTHKRSKNHPTLAKWNGDTEKNLYMQSTLSRVKTLTNTVLTTSKCNSVHRRLYSPRFITTKPITTSRHTAANNRMDTIECQHPHPWYFIDACIILTLKNRGDRHKSIFNELKSQNLLHKTHIMVNDKDPEGGLRGCYMSHYAAAQLMLHHKWKRVLIIEDDAIFEPNAHDRIENSMAALPKSNAKFMRLMIGHIPIMPILDISTGLFKGPSLATTAYIMSPLYAAWFPTFEMVDVIPTGTMWQGLFGRGLDHAHNALINDKTFLMVPSAILFSPEVGSISDHPTGFWAFTGWTSLKFQRILQYASLGLQIGLITLVGHKLLQRRTKTKSIR